MTELERLYREMCDDGDVLNGIWWGVAISCLAIFIMGCIGLVIVYGNDWP